MNCASAGPHASSAESAFIRLYPEIWLPKLEEGTIAIERIAVGGRPLQTTLSDRKLARIFERSMELLTQVQQRVFTTLNPAKIVDLFKLGEEQPPQLGIRCADVVTGFYSYLGFTRLSLPRSYSIETRCSGADEEWQDSRSPPSYSLLILMKEDPPAGCRNESLLEISRSSF